MATRQPHGLAACLVHGSAWWFVRTLDPTDPTTPRTWPLGRVHGSVVRGLLDGLAVPWLNGPDSVGSGLAGP
ncbi:hypothetical protein [Kibdelosporangium philippinense]|uniref:hypothetical protein n=1 Tax=Kibdelosporangium philippinense TaxID=211113 RepID=UPI003620B621